MQQGLEGLGLSGGTASARIPGESGKCCRWVSRCISLGRLDRRMGCLWEQPCVRLAGKPAFSSQPGNGG